MSDDDIDFFDETDIDFFSDEVDDAAPGQSTKGVKGALGKVVGEARSLVGRGDGSGSSLSAEERLSSVVNESTPGAALELMRVNERFAFKKLNAYVLLVLPTRGEFGGLSKRSKDEARGTIINLIDSDNIHAVVTSELLADDALGIVPDAQSLERMEEISLLTGARYLYGIACEDTSTGEIKVFSVPPIQQEAAIDGQLFTQAQAISRGELSLTDVLNESVVEAMLTIYRSADDPVSGSEALAAAEKANMDFLVVELQKGHYPSAVEVLDNLAGQFPALGGRSGGRHRAEVEAVADDVPTQAIPAVVEEIDPFSDPESLVDDDEPEDDFSVPVEVAPIDEDEPEDVFDEAPATPAQAVTQLPPEAVTELTKVTDERFAELKEMLEGVTSRLAADKTTPGGVRINDGSEAAEITVEPGSEFSYEDALKVVGRVYGDDELKLEVDPRPFVDRLVSPVPQINVPLGSHTEWLGEQAQALTSALNTQLRKLHVDNQQMLYRQFMHMADLAAKEVSWEFDPLRNPDSVWGKGWSALEQDKRTINERGASGKRKAEDEVRERWQARRRQFVDDAAARAGQDFDHRNAGKIEAEVRQAGDDYLATLEAISSANVTEFHEHRGVTARVMFEEKISDILGSLEKPFSAQQAQENEAFEAALAAVTSFIDEHRREDVIQADATLRKLESDNRYEQALSQAEAQINAIRRDTDLRVEAMKDEMRERTEAFNRATEMRDHNYRLELENRGQRERALEERLRTQAADFQAELAALQTQAEARVEMAEAAKAEAIALNAQREEKAAQMSTAAVVLIVVGAIILVSLGLIAGATLL